MQLELLPLWHICIREKPKKRFQPSKFIILSNKTRIELICCCFRRWKKVGKIVDLNLFPIKSCAPIKESSFDCHILGISEGELFDRCFVVASPNKKQVTARTYPKMVLIHPRIVGNQLFLSAPDKSDITLDLDEIKTKKVSAKIGCWYTSVDGIDCGDAVAEWLSEFIAGKKDSVRLFFYPYLHPTKGKSKSDKIYKQLLTDDAGAFHDSTSYMMINQASIDEINSHLDHIVKPLQFRPNFVIRGPNAFDEDNWKWIRIGENVIFRVVKPCGRYEFSHRLTNKFLLVLKLK